MIAQSDLLASFEKLKLGVKNKSELPPATVEKAALKEAAKAVLSLRDPALPQLTKVTVSSFDSQTSGKGIFVDRVDATNFTNSTMFGAPTSDITSPTFGRIRNSTTSGSRKIQLGAKFYF